MPERKIKSPALRQAAYRASGAPRLLQDSCAISSCHTRRWVNLPWLTTRRAALFKGRKTVATRENHHAGRRPDGKGRRVCRRTG
nr:Uncharacterised protein [Klebsiella pneumoniae]